MKRSDLTLGSLFDGSGGFPLGGLISGITPVWSSEIEPFPIRVTTKRLPFVKHYGDVSTLDGAKLEPVDIITFGSPCQDMSIAGKRAGLDGSRSNLFYEAIRIVKEMREKTNGEKPRYIVWENVPGAFSSNKGEDFKAVLEAVCGIKESEADIPRYEKWPNAGLILANDFSVAWRVFDAQYWGVPQRRKRIYLVSDLDSGSAGKILFESEGVSGYPAQSRGQGQDAAADAGEGTATAGFDGYNGMLTDDVAATLGINCGMSSGRNGVMVLNDQGGNRMDVTEEVTSTLRAEAHHPPVVVGCIDQGAGKSNCGVSLGVSPTLSCAHDGAPAVVTNSAGFCTEHSAKARSIGFEDEKSPTLRAGVVPAAVFENHAQDSRYTGPHDVAQTVLSTFGSGGNNQPFVVENAGCFDVRFTSEGTRNARQNVYETDTSRTIDCGGNSPDSNQGGVAVVEAYGVCSKDSNAMKSDNPKSGFYKASTSRTLDGNGGNPCCNQGGIAVVEGNGSRPSHQGDGYRESDVMYTLNATEQHGVAYGIDRATYNMGQNAKFDISIKEEVEPAIVAKGPGAVAHPVYHSSKASFHTNFSTDEASDTLVATDYKDPPCISEEPYYIVRRLTPIECARLQGFPDGWCAELETAEPTEEELAFWRDVFETHRKVMGTSAKPKSDAQIIKWLKNPHSDSAEYRMWGNGVCLNNVVFVLSGIVHYAAKD